MDEKFYIGSYENESKRNGGWFIGYFMQEGLRKTDKFEVKYWEFPPGKAAHEKKVQRSALEFTIILRGRIEGEINGGKIKLEAGDYVIIPSRVENGFPISKEIRQQKTCSIENHCIVPVP